MSDADWMQVYRLAKTQDLIGIVYSAIERLPKNQLPQMDLLMSWFGQVEYIQIMNEKYRKTAHELLDTLHLNGLKPVVLKGESCARYYPRPNLRALGDLDIYLLDYGDASSIGGHEWAYEKGNRLAALLGAKVELHDYKHSQFVYKGLMVENHRLLTTARGKKVKKEFEAELQRLLDEEHEAQFEALFLTIHAFQHFMESKLSLRMLCDWTMFVEKRYEEVDWTAYMEWMNRLCMTKFANVFWLIIKKYFAIKVGFSHFTVEDKKLARMLLDDTLYGQQELLSSENIICYRMWQMRNLLKNSWKYRAFKNQNVVEAYTKMMWYHWFDKI